jgi:hypothetical protein
MAISRGPNLNRDGLVLYLDAANSKSYPGSGTDWFDILGSSNKAALINGPLFNGDNGGSIVFDGVDDIFTFDDEISIEESWTINYWQNLNINRNTFSIPTFFSITPQGGSNSPGSFGIRFNQFTSVSSIYIDGANNIYVGGQFGGYDDIVRDTIVKINSDGSPNSDFNSGVSIGNAGVLTVNKIDKLPNGNIITIGTNWGQAGVRVFNSLNGTTIPSLTTATSISTSFIMDEATNSMWILDSWANVYQSRNTEGKIFKIDLTNFNIDTDFDSSTGFKSAVGKTTVSLTEGVNNGIILQDGNLLCVGSFREYKGTPADRIVKINSINADLDTSFNYGTGFNSTTNRCIQMNDGTIVVSGIFTSYNGNSCNRIIGLNTDGSINTEFNIGTGFNNSVSIIYDSVNDKIFCFGTFTSYNGVSANRIVKLNSDGSVDSSFNYGTGFNSGTSTGAIDTLGRLVVLGGPTLTYKGQLTPRRICRINSDGSLDTTFTTDGFNLDRFRQDTQPRLIDNSIPFLIGFFGINSNREVINLPNGAMTFNGFKYYTISFNHSNNQILTYIDGNLRRTFNLTSRLPLRIKTIRSFQNLFIFNIYDRVLSQQEIAQNFNASKSRFA